MVYFSIIIVDYFWVIIYNELEEANTKCSKLRGIIDEATDLVDDALRTDDGEMYGRLREIKDTLEG